MLCQNKSHAIEGGSRLQEGQTEVMPSKAARGDWKLGANCCWGTLRSEERLVASLTATPWSGVRSGAERIPVFWSGMLNLECSPCTAVMKKVIPRMVPFFSHGLQFRA